MCADEKYGRMIHFA